MAKTVPCRVLVIAALGLLLSLAGAAPAADSAAAPSVPRPQIPDRTFAITDYGAKPDGATMNTAAIAKAIAACKAAGGGVVVVPAGKFLTGPLTLASKMDLR